MRARHLLKKGRARSRTASANVPVDKSTGRDDRDVILCVGNPPELRRLLSMRRAGQVVVIRDLARAWRFLAKNPVSRVLLDMALLASPMATSPAAAGKWSGRRSDTPEAS